MAQRRKRVLADLDATAADLFTPWLRKYNLKHGDDLSVDRILSWDLHLYAKAGEAIYDELAVPGFFADLVPYAGAVDALEEINKEHELLIVSAAHVDGPTCASEKLLWVKNWLPFLNKKQVILAHRKELIEADVLVDDSPNKAAAYRKAHPEAEIYGIEFAYNSRCPAFNQVFPGHHAPAAAWAQIREKLR